MPDIELPTASTLSGATLTFSQRERAARALRNIGAPGTKVEIRSTPADRAGLSNWVRGALSFVAIASAASVFSPSVDAKGLGPIQSARQTQQDAAMVALAARVADHDLAAHTGDAWKPLLPTVTVRIDGHDLPAMHPLDRVRLCQVIAKQEKLEAVGRDWRDLYAVIEAETAWAPRVGYSVKGVPSYGLAQVEMATARAYGIEDPQDPRQAVALTARLVKESVAWARSRGLELKDAAISVHYNLSTAARNAWDGKTIDSLPIPTQHHIANFMHGRQSATYLGQQRTVFDRVLARELNNRAEIKMAMAAASRAVAAPAPHIAIRSVENGAMLRSVEDESRGRVRQTAARPMFAANAPTAREPIAMSAAGLKAFAAQLSTALASTYHQTLASAERVATTVPVDISTPRAKARFAAKFPVLTEFLADQVDSVTSYVRDVGSAYAISVSTTIGGRESIERVALRRRQAQSQLAAAGGVDAYASRRTDDAVEKSSAPTAGWQAQIATTPEADHTTEGVEHDGHDSDHEVVRERQRA